MINLKFQEIVGFLLGPEAGEDRLNVYYPALDVYENADELCIEMEIPGVNQEDVNVEIMGSTIRISGMKKDAFLNKGVRYIRMERGFGKFSRDLEIPDRFDLNQVDAKFKDGVLMIRITRSPQKVEVVKRIEVK